VNSATLTDEQLRILRAARDGWLRTDERGFWQIENDLPPMSHERSWLRYKALLRSVEHVDGFLVGMLTDAGRAALEAA
jgi:hypothetical protein